MAVTPEKIIESIIDELAMGDLAERIDAFRFERTGPGSLLPDYGQHGRFRLDVVPEPQI